MSQASQLSFLQNNDGIVTISTTSASVSTATGALVVRGGAGLGGDLQAGGALFASLRRDVSSSSTAFGVYYNPVTRELTTSTAGGGASVVISDTPPVSPSVGTLWFDSNQAELRIYYQDQDSSQWVGANSSAISALTDPIVANDISNQFNGLKAVFQLRQNQSLINTVVDSKDVEVLINGRRLAPYVDEIRFPWFTPYDSYKGFVMVNNQNLYMSNHTSYVYIIYEKSE